MYSSNFYLYLLCVYNYYLTLIYISTVLTVSREAGSRLSRSITVECESAAAVDSVENESEGRLKSPGSLDYREKGDIMGDKRSSKVQLLDRNSKSFLPPNATKRNSVSKLMSNMLKRIVYPTSTSTSTSTSSTNVNGTVEETRSIIPEGFGEIPAVVTPNTKAKR